MTVTVANVAYEEDTRIISDLIWKYKVNGQEASVTRSGDLLDFGQIFKTFGNNKFAQISHILREFL